MKRQAAATLPLVEAPQTDLGMLVLRSLEDRWDVLHHDLESVRQKATTKKVHDLRIALRRMSSILALVDEILGGKPAARFSRRLDKLLKALGDVRDVQVQRKEVGRMAETYAALADFHRRLRKRERKLEPRAEKRLQSVSAERLRGLFEAVTADALLGLSSEALQTRHRATVLQAVDRRFSDVIDARRALDVADLGTVHRMRVAFKKFRYMVEVLQPLLIGMGRAQLDSMQAFQTLMGDVHDLDVLNQMLVRYRAKHGKNANELVAAQDEIGRRLLHSTDALMASADEIFGFWNQSYLPADLQG